MSRVYRTSKPDHSVVPRAHTDAHQRYRTYGKIVPMDRPDGEPSLFVGFLAATGGLGGIALFFLIWEIFA